MALPAQLDSRMVLAIYRHKERSNEATQGQTCPGLESHKIILPRSGTDVRHRRRERREGRCDV